jgi:hypothetical protein
MKTITAILASVKEFTISILKILLITLLLALPTIPAAAVVVKLIVKYFIYFWQLI